VKIAPKERSDDCNFHDKRNYQVEAVVLRGFTSISTMPWTALLNTIKQIYINKKYLLTISIIISLIYLLISYL